jgi:hypothetical protein
MLRRADWDTVTDISPQYSRSSSWRRRSTLLRNVRYRAIPVVNAAVSISGLQEDLLLMWGLIIRIGVIQLTAGRRDGHCEGWCHVGCDAAQSSTETLTLRRNIMPPFLGQTPCADEGDSGFLLKAHTHSQTTRYHIPENINFERRGGENITSHGNGNLLPWQ